MKTTTTMGLQPLHSLEPQSRRHFNRVFAGVYTFGLLSLFYHHLFNLLHPTNIIHLFISILLFLSDFSLAYMWSSTQAFRMNPVIRKVFPEKLEKVLDRKDFPAIDIFICTADPYKEPPINVVNTALSVMAYEYPSGKLSVYVSDDGGSELTMFAFMEAAKFGKIWLPFCKENNIMDRCPDVYFRSNYALTAQAVEVKMMYESMKIKLENAIERGFIGDEYILSDEDRRLFTQFRTNTFTRQNHPSLIQVFLNSNKDVDKKGQSMPNLVYLSREKSKTTSHHFKAGALNALLRVSGVMTNAPIILTLDCDMYSNDPSTLERVLCFLSDKLRKSNWGYVQFPQRFHGLNKADIYASEHKRLFIVNPSGMDGLAGPSYVGTGCFFHRRVFFGGPLTYIEPEIPELSLHNNIVDKSIESENIQNLAHHVSGCTYEDKTNWGYKIGFRYGSLVEDYYTGYRLQCEGWHSIFCNPSRAAFLGDVPITLIDVLSQTKRWDVGLLEVALSKFCPLTFGIRSLGLLMGQDYAHYAFWPIWAIPITIYAFIPSLALLNQIPIFPKVYEPWFFLYIFLFLGAYGQDCIDFLLYQGTLERWWSDQRMWLIRGLSCHLFGTMEFICNSLGMETHGFNVTSKVMDDEQSKKYDQGMFEFGVSSPLFVPLAMAAVLNLIALLCGILLVVKERSLDKFLIQILIAGYGTLNSLPFYEAMLLRRDKGRMPIRTTFTSTIFTGIIYAVSYILLKT